MPRHSHLYTRSPCHGLSERSWSLVAGELSLETLADELRLEENTELAEGQAEGVDESEDSLQLEENMEGLEGGPPAVLV